MADQPINNHDPVVERVHVERILHRAGVDEQMIKKTLSGVTFPARISQIAPLLMHLGITRDRLVDGMGGSP